MVSIGMSLPSVAFFACDSPGSVPASNMHACRAAAA